MFHYFKTVFYIISTILIVVVVGLIGFGAYNNFKAMEYSVDGVIAKYIKILDNPAKDFITSEEKLVLSEIVETSAVASWFNQAENQIKTLRYFKQDKPITVKPAVFSGADQNYATVELQLQNNLSGEQSKTAKLYLQKQGSLLYGYRWKIYQIDLPMEQNPLDQLRKEGQNLLQNLPEIKNPF